MFFGRYRPTRRPIVNYIPDSPPPTSYKEILATTCSSCYVRMVWSENLKTWICQKCGFRLMTKEQEEDAKSKAKAKAEKEESEEEI